MQTRETLPFAKFLQQHAFHEDMHKRQRLADIAVRSQLLDTHRGKHGYGKRTRRRQTAKRRTPVGGVSTMTLLAAFTACASVACLRLLTPSGRNCVYCAPRPRRFAGAIRQLSATPATPPHAWPHRLMRQPATRRERPANRMRNAPVTTHKSRSRRASGRRAVSPPDPRPRPRRARPDRSSDPVSYTQIVK